MDDTKTPAQNNNLGTGSNPPPAPQLVTEPVPPAPSAPPAAPAFQPLPAQPTVSAAPATLTQPVPASPPPVPPDENFTVSTSPPPPKKSSKKLIGSLIALVILSFGLIGGLLVVKQNQDNRQRAVECTDDASCTTSGFGGWVCHDFGGGNKQCCPGGVDACDNIGATDCHMIGGNNTQVKCVTYGFCPRGVWQTTGNICTANPSPTPPTGSPDPSPDLPPGDGPVCNPVGQVEWECPLQPPEEPKNKCHQCGSNNRWIQSGAPGCDPTKPGYFTCNACDTTIYPNRVCYGPTPSDPPNPKGEVIYNTPEDCLGAKNVGNLAIRYTAKRCVCQGAVGACDGTGATCNQVTEGILVVDETKNSIICYAGPAACTSEQIDIDFWLGTTNVGIGGGIIKSSTTQGEACINASPLPSTTPGPSASPIAQCTSIKFYKVTGEVTNGSNWTQLSKSELEALKPTNVVYITTLGTSSNGAVIDKARIRVNKSSWDPSDETTDKKPKVNATDSDEYYVTYTIPGNGTTSFTFGAEVHDKTGVGRWY